MVKLVEVDPKDIPTNREGRRGRVSYPLLKQFLESGIRCAKLDLTGLDKNVNYLRSILYSYIRSHGLPVKLFSAAGDLHFLRLDMDDKGNVDPNWKPEQEVASEGSAGHLRSMEPLEITSVEVQRRFNEEKGAALK